VRGNITRRGRSSWRLKFDVGRDPVIGRRITRFVTVRGKRQDAEKELARLVSAAHDGMLVEPSKLTVAEYLNSWLNGTTDLTGKTLERYKQLAAAQIIPHLGATLLQRLRPLQIQEWHSTLIKSGGRGGKPLSPRTVGHAHRVLHRALERAVKAEIVSRNAVHAITPPKVEGREVQSLRADEMPMVIAKMKDHRLYPIVSLALGAGLRRGELLALRWTDIDFDANTVRVERSLEETKAGLHFKAPKTRHGRRTITVPASVLEPLRPHWKAQMETRLVLGLGRSETDSLIFARPDGSPMSPDNLSRDWRRAAKALGLPRVMFHALRHSHASALIAGGLDVLTVSRRLGHGTPVVTLTTYAHLFEKTDSVAVKAIEAALGTDAER
jgi:integrase